MLTLVWNANGSATILGRLCTRDGTGGASPVAAEGNLNTAADYASPGSLVLSVYDITGGSLTPTYTVTLDPVSAVTALATGGIYQPPNVPDGKGCNFLADLPATAFPVAHHVHRVVVKATTNGGTIGWGVWEGPARPTAPP